MGEMMNYFDIANVVFMGGSLVKTGGHNMLEPAALAKPIIFGTYVFNFAEISTDLLNQNAAIQVQNADELFVEITRLLTHDNTAESLGNNAQQYLQSKQGATDKLMQKITSLLPQ
jgi:3-deoxy-D-manno-octulosonic-acid transferase